MDLSGTAERRNAGKTLASLPGIDEAERRKDTPSAVPLVPPYRIPSGFLLLRHAVVDDPRRDQDNQVAPLFRVRMLKQKSLPTIGRLPSSGMPAAGLGHLGDGQAADDRGLAVVHQELVVGLLLREDEAEVGRGERHESPTARCAAA